MADNAKNRKVRDRRLAADDASNEPAPIARTRLAETIEHNGRIYQLMVEAVRDYAIFMLDPNGYVASWNTGAERIKGYTAAEIIGQHFSVFYPPEAAASGHPQHELEIAVAEGRFEEEGWRVKKDGGQFWANVVITAVRDETGALVGFAKVTRDLTERRNAELKAKEDAHRVAASETANVAKQHLLGIISDLLNFSRIEAGTLTYDIRQLSLKQVIEGVVPLIEPQAAAKEIVLKMDTTTHDCLVLGDRAKVDQILLNLLSNAIKFTDSSGAVTVECNESGNTASIAVVDTGSGIPPDKLDAIFEPFVQLGRSLSSAHEGTGLGLAISRELARAMKGNLTVSSKVGSGSTFTLTLPRAQ
jgi:PAS domain S-box-containing protein